LLLAYSSFALEDPRQAIKSVRECTEAAKSYRASTEYTGDDNERALLAACRNTSADCVHAVGDSLHSVEPHPGKTFLDLVRACHGHGMAKCFRAAADKVPSFERQEYAQILALLAQCR
jgi:hypothetical protein